MTVEHVGEWDFGVIGLTLQAIFDTFLSPEEKDLRVHYMAEAERTWYVRSIADREEWYRKVRATQAALREMSFKKDARLLAAIDELFQCPRTFFGHLATAGELMAEAHDMWRHLGDLRAPTDFQLCDEICKRFAVNEMSVIRLLYDYRWTESGFPLVKISPKFAAAAMCTKLTSEVLEDLRGPWKAFDIEMPKEEVLYQWSSTMRPVPVAHVLVLYGDNPNDVDRRWCINLKSNTEGEVTTRIWMKSSELCSEVGVGDTFTMPWNERGSFDEQALMLAGRVVASVICALTDPKMVVEVDRRRHEAWKRRPVFSRGSELATRTYQLVAPVTIDLVKKVCDYQLHRSNKKAWKLLVQSTVCGHWKMQVCGSGRLDRKKIWVQPYPRGPRNAPVAVKSHVIMDGD